MLVAVKAANAFLGTIRYDFEESGSAL